MSTEDRYNGWTNRETWALVLWIDDDQGLYTMVGETVGDDLASHAGEYTERHAGAAVKMEMQRLLDPDQYREEFGSEQGEELRRMSYDIGSLYRVDWDAVGAHYLEDAIGNATQQDSAAAINGAS